MAISIAHKPSDCVAPYLSETRSETPTRGLSILQVDSKPSIEIRYCNLCI